MMGTGGPGGGGLGLGGGGGGGCGGDGDGGEGEGGGGGGGGGEGGGGGGGEQGTVKFPAGPPLHGLLPVMVFPHCIPNTSNMTAALKGLENAAENCFAAAGPYREAVRILTLPR